MITDELSIETPMMEIKPTMDETLRDSPVASKAIKPAKTAKSGAAMVMRTFRTDRYMIYSVARIRNSATGMEIMKRWNDFFISLNMPLHSM